MALLGITFVFALLSDFHWLPTVSFLIMIPLVLVTHKEKKRQEIARGKAMTPSEVKQFSDRDYH